ncbi:low-temperature-induced 65 kDa protein-like isoform X5 [Chenopodium quinoa]|uniref:low-temperature-induced 65 kDa protein-like isoform X5 n=1 Tax=Chenopodium quinoa TaxID=63459 RepID=UPI000B76FA17|nr:low-temperature-induced 65 kDa protein-like isoform X5 [Chenopodium quinoa]
MDHPRGHNTTTYEYDDDPHRHDQNVGIEIGHNEEHHGEKKSVLKKVKAKAKKIKDSIKEHVGHGHDHDHDENDDEDDEMDMDPEIHGTHTAQHLMPGQEGTARRHTHTREPQFGTAGEGARSKQSSYHTFDPTTARHTPGQEDNLGWSKTEAGKLNEYDEHEQPYAPKNTPVGTLLGGGHSTGDLDMGKKGPPVKLGTVVGGSTGVEEDPQFSKDVEEDHHPATYQVRVIDPTGTGNDSKAGQGFMSGPHRTERGEMIQSPKSKFQGDFQSFDPSTTRYVPGQDETLDWSRTDTGRQHRSEELTNASTNTAIAAQAGHDSATAHSFMPGLHRSEADERTERERAVHSPRRKFQGDFQTFDPSTTSYIPGQEETLGWSRTDTGRPHRPEEPSHASKNIPIAGYDSTAAQSFMPGQHRSNLGERTEREGVPHSPKSKYLDDFHTFDPSTTSHVSGQEETLGWSRTDTGRLNGSEEQSNASKNSPIAAHSRYDSTDTHMPQSFMPGQHRSILGERTAMEGALDDPEDKLQGDHVTFVHTTTSYVPGQEETLDWFRPDTGRLNESEELSNASKSTPVAAHSGQEETLDWSRTDTGRPNRLEELFNASKNTPISAHTVRNHRMGADEERGTGKFGGLLENSGELLDKDPNTPRGPGERRYAGNYETKVGDPTGMGGEEVGVSPILHQLDKMNIHDEPHQNSRLGDAQLNRTKHSPRDENVFTGSHDQFFPEPVSSEESIFLQDTGPESGRTHEMSEQKQESYTEKISSTAAMVADKAKQATSSVTSKLGYGDSSDQHSADASSGMHEKSSEPVGFGEKISNVTAAITDKAVQAKNAVATTLGYGGNQEEQPHVNEGESRVGAPVYGNVATVALKMQDSGRDVHSPSTTGPSTEMDKGVSMKEYLAEKLKPGEEDKALSDVITEAFPLHKRKEDVSRVGEEGKGDKVTVIGRVTESEEVARQFGRSEETNYDNAGTGMASAGKGVFDRLRDAATFWYQKGTEVPSQDDMVEGNEGSPVISSMESEQKREQKRQGGSGLQ